MSPWTWRAVAAGTIVCGAVSGAGGVSGAPGWWVVAGVVVGLAVTLAWAALEDLGTRLREASEWSSGLGGEMDRMSTVTAAFLAETTAPTAYPWCVRDVTDDHLVALDPLGRYWRVPYRFDAGAVTFGDAVAVQPEWLWRR
jgi:hypothetical protein